MPAISAIQIRTPSGLLTQWTVSRGPIGPKRSVTRRLFMRFVPENRKRKNFSWRLVAIRNPPLLPGPEPCSPYAGFSVTPPLMKHAAIWTPMSPWYAPPRCPSLRTCLLIAAMLRSFACWAILYSPSGRKPPVFFPAVRPPFLKRAN